VVLELIIELRTFTAWCRSRSWINVLANLMLVGMMFW